MDDGLIAFNGVDGSTGAPLTPPVSDRDLAGIAQEARDDAITSGELTRWHARKSRKTLGPEEGVDALDLASAGWGVIFAHGTPGEIREALAPLLRHRAAEANRKQEYFREYSGNLAYRGGQQPETKRDFLARHGASVGMPAHPKRVPYYLLIVGDPETIPFSLQAQLDVEYAVGRLWFEKDGKADPDAFERYATSVVLSETGGVALARRAAFIGVENPGDRATRLSARELVAPLVEALQTERPDWVIRGLLGEEADKTAFARVINGPDAPALLFTASHGVGFRKGDPRQLRHQGALLCQDWPGFEGWGSRPIPPEHYFAAEDVAASARPLGQIVFNFACYSGGTPRVDDYPHLKRLVHPETIAPRAFVAPLAQRLLAHPAGGALAVIGHTERAWSCSFHGGPGLGKQLGAFESTLRRLLSGAPVGYAMEYFNQLHAALSTDLVAQLARPGAGRRLDVAGLAGTWTTNNDARSYLVLGDPAVRLRLAEGSSGAVRQEVPAAAPRKAPPPLSEYEIEVDVEVLPVSAPEPVSPEDYARICIDADYDSREGYDPEFLGDEGLAVAMPRLSKAQRASAVRLLAPLAKNDPCELRYHHFSVFVDSERRLALFTAVNIDGRFAETVERSSDSWYYDPRIPRSCQVGPEAYGLPLDRGHLVRRLDPAWGRAALVAKRANDDTFHFTNCVPQHGAFNQRKNVWAGLEDFVRKRATGPRARLIVFTGPVFSKHDPLIRGVRVPAEFWKVIVVARPGGRLSSLGFMASQKHLLDAASFGPEDVAQTFQVPVAQLAQITGLDFRELVEVDHGTVANYASGDADRRSLEGEEDIQIPG